MADTRGVEGSTAAFLARASRRLTEDGRVFAGFHWPILAARVARRLGRSFDELYEAGVVVSGLPATLPSSSTDYDAYRGEVTWRGSTPDLLAMVPRLDVVVLDAASVDVAGRINTFGEDASFRSAGGGGSADVAARARHLVLLHGSPRPDRLVRRVSAVTASPGPHARVELLTRWGAVRLGAVPELTEVVDAAEPFLSHLAALGVDIAAATPSAPVSADEHAAAAWVLEEARARGYRAASGT